MGGTYGPAFYTSICRLLSALNGGIKHQRASVTLPLSKVCSCGCIALCRLLLPHHTSSTHPTHHPTKHRLAWS
jgi:hypothetical protein